MKKTKEARNGGEERRKGDATDAPRNVHNRFLFSEEGLPVPGRRVRGNGNLERGEVGLGSKHRYFFFQDG